MGSTAVRTKRVSHELDETNSLSNASGQGLAPHTERGSTPERGPPPQITSRTWRGSLFTQESQDVETAPNPGCYFFGGVNKFKNLRSHQKRLKFVLLAFAAPVTALCPLHVHISYLTSI